MLYFLAFNSFFMGLNYLMGIIILFSVVWFLPKFSYMIKRKDSYFNRLKYKFLYKKNTEFRRFNNEIEKNILKKYKVIDDDLIHLCNNFYESLNKFEKKNLNYFISNEKMEDFKINNFNFICYQSVKDYISKTSTISLLENREEVFYFIEMSELPTWQDELITLFKNRVKNTKKNTKTNKLKYHKGLIQEEINNCDVLSQQLNIKKKIKNDKNKKVIIQNI